MQAIESRQPFGRTYAEPLSGLRVSWGAVLAGTVTMLSVSLILWLLGFAIVMLTMNPTGHAMRGAIIALWIIAMCTTLVGAFAGGFVAGALPGNPSARMGAAHGFLSWGLAMILSLLFAVLTIAGTVRLAANTGVTAASAAVQTTGAAAGGAAGSNIPLEVRARQTLISLGYSPAQADRMVAQVRSAAQQTLQGNQGPNIGAAVGSAASDVGKAFIDLGIAMGWSEWGTWFVAMLLALGGGVAGAGRLRAREEGAGGELEYEREVPMEPTPTGPLTPAPSP